MTRRWRWRNARARPKPTPPSRGMPPTSHERWRHPRCAPDSEAARFAGHVVAQWDPWLEPKRQRGAVLVERHAHAVRGLARRHGEPDREPQCRAEEDVREVVLAILEPANRREPREHPGR